ncbi:MAG: hypothetical protein ACRCSP_04065 [Rhodoglobus sp.]
MEPVDTLRLLLLVIHFLGLAAVVGSFLVQMRNKTGFDFRLMLGGSIVQLLSGLLLVGARQAQDLDVDNAKIAVKLLLAVVVLVAVLFARARQKRALSAGTTDRVSLPWLHIAGAGAIVNIFIAVLWT